MSFCCSVFQIQNYYKLRSIQNISILRTKKQHGFSSNCHFTFQGAFIKIMPECVETCSQIQTTSPLQTSAQCKIHRQEPAACSWATEQPGKTRITACYLSILNSEICITIIAVFLFIKRLAYYLKYLLSSLKVYYTTNPWFFLFFFFTF